MQATWRKKIDVVPDAQEYVYIDVASAILQVGESDECCYLTVHVYILTALCKTSHFTETQLLSKDQNG